jgi:hypothetical protein
VAVSAEATASVSWSGLVSEHEAYLEEKRDKSLVFVGDGYENDGEIMSVPYTHRWTREYTERQYAQMHDFVRGAMGEYDDPYIVIFPALTASTTDARGEYRAPLDHFDQLKQSWSRGVRYELHEVMEADRKKDTYPSREWEYLQVWEPTTDAGYTEGGYAHCHPVVVCDGKVEAERFRSVMEKHVEKCGWAKPAAHDVNEIDIRPLDDLANPAAYLFKYLSKSWGGDPEPYQRRFDALLHETGYRRFQPSDGAQRWMEREESEAAEPWLFAGVAEPTQIETLEQYSGVEEFQIEHEMGVGSYLSGYGEPSGVAVDDDETVREACDHDTWHGGQCVGCGITERQLILYGSKDGPPGAS